MNLDIGTIFRSFIGLNQDAVIPTQLFQSSVGEDEDVQIVEELHIPGFQYKPSTNSRDFIARISDAWKVAVGVDDFVPKESLLEGERLFYADLAKVITARIRLSPDGTLAIGNLLKPMISTPPQVGTELLEIMDRFMTIFEGVINLAGSASETKLLASVITEIGLLRTDLGNIKGGL